MFLAWPALAGLMGVGTGSNVDIWRIGIAVVAAAIVWFLFNRRGERGPKPGEFWMADVPFADGTGSKDRPCMVLDRRGPRCSVLYITSKDKSADDSYVRIDNSRWPGRISARDSWMRVAQRNGSDPSLQVNTRNFRRRLGRIGAHDAVVLQQRGFDVA